MLTASPELAADCEPGLSVEIVECGVVSTAADEMCTRSAEVCFSRR